MKRLQLNIGTLTVVFILVGLVIAGLEFIFATQPNATLLLTLAYWISLVQGSIALMVVADLSNARWNQPIKKDLLSLYPLLALFSVLFLLIYPQLDIYSWASHEHGWFSKKFFMIRNELFLLLSFLFARMFVRAVAKESPRKNLIAVLYLFTFVISQSLIAFDWIMPLEYPWYSTLFGGLHFIEAIYSGIAITIILCYILILEHEGNLERLRKTLTDGATMMFGFSVLWAGLFYAQYLTIWYGNLPEEVGYIFHRINTAPYRQLSMLFVVSLFFIPFVGLISRAVKHLAGYVSIIGAIVLVGIFIERLVFITPDAPVFALPLIVNFLLLGLLMVLIIVNRHKLSHFAGEED